MSSLLEAASTVPNKIEVTDQLPVKVGNVSIMSIEQLFKALENSRDDNRSFCHHDPSPFSNGTVYHVYGIVGLNGENSTIENLQAVGLDWYKQLNKPRRRTQTFINNGKTIFGGPLAEVCHNLEDGADLLYSLTWLHSVNFDAFGDAAHSDDSEFWGDGVCSSVYIAVARARE